MGELANGFFKRPETLLPHPIIKKVSRPVCAIVAVFRRRKEIGGLRFTYQAPALRHFTAEFEPLYQVGG